MKLFLSSIAVVRLQYFFDLDCQIPIGLLVWYISRCVRGDCFYVSFADPNIWDRMCTGKHYNMLGWVSAPCTSRMEPRNHRLE